MHYIKTKFLFILFISAATALYGQTGPAGVGMNDGTSSLKLWLDAGKLTFMDTLQKNPSLDGAKVMFWKDLSGSKNHVFAEKDTTSPTLTLTNPLMNGQAALRFYFNGFFNKKTYLTSSTFSSTNDITIYCVFHALTKGGGNNITPYKASAYHPNMWYYGAGLVDAGSDSFTNDVSLTFCDTSIAAGTGDVTTSTDYCVKIPASLNKTYFATLQKEAWTGILSINKNAGIPAKFQAGLEPINKAPRYIIGSTSNFNSIFDTTYFNGYIANVIVYNRLLTLAEQIILQNYLSAKYNIPLERNDLYSFDNFSEGNFDYDLVGVGMADDGSIQAEAKGDGFIKISNANDLDKGSFVFIANDGKSLKMRRDENPEGILERIERNWIYSKIGPIQKIDFTVDPNVVPSIAKDDLVLLIDTDNNGLFSDEIFGKGIIPVSDMTSQGQYRFKGLGLNHGNRFTLAKLEHACKSNCDVYFTPNGDGTDDIYYISISGKTSIYDRSGKLIKTLSTPAYWDGSNETGQISSPGIYFLISNEDTQQTVTLIR